MNETPSILARLYRNPIVVRELRVGGRSMRFFAAMMASLLVQLAVVSIVIVSHVSNDRYSDTSDVGRTAFFAETVTMLITIVIVFPALSCMTIVSERESRALDMLLLSHLTTWEIVYGKLVSALSQASLFVALSIPVYALILSFGGVSMSVLAFVLAAFAVLSVLVSMVGIYSSVVFRRPLAALIVSYIGAQVFGFAAFGIVSAVYSDLLFDFGLLARLELLKPVERVSIVLGVALTAVLYFTLFFLVSVARLKTASQNRSSALRIFSICAVAAIVAGMFIFSFAGERIPATVLPYVLISLCAVAAIGALFPAIRSASEAAFAPRVVRREFEARKLPPARRWLSWLLLPGSTSGLTLALILCFVAFVSLAVCASAMIGRVAETAPVAELRESLTGFGRNWGESALMQRIPQALDLREHAPPRSGGEQRELRDAYAAYGAGIWRLSSLAFLIVSAFAVFGWSLSFTAISPRAIAAIGIGLAFATIAIPMLVSGVPGLGLEEARSFSPLSAWRECVNLSVLDAQASLAPGRETLDAIDRERSTAYARMLPSVGFLFLLAAGSAIAGIHARKGALKKMREAGERWPPPRIPRRAAPTSATTQPSA